MKKFIKICIRITGILIIILGTIHLFATPYAIHRFANLSDEQLLVFISMFVATGLGGVILPGIIILLLLKSINTKNSRLWYILLIISIYMLLIGTGSVLAMTKNPFAYITLFLGLLIFILVLLYRKVLNKQQE